MPQAKPGLVIASHDTATLLRSYANALRVLQVSPDEHDYEIGEARTLAVLLDAPQPDPLIEEYALSVLTACFNALDTHAPCDHYFGVRKGSDNEFGFWPIPLVEDDR